MATNRKIIVFGAATAVVGAALLLARMFPPVGSVPPESAPDFKPSAAVRSTAPRRLTQVAIQNRPAERAQPADIHDVRMTELWNSILQALTSGDTGDRDNVLTNLLPALLAEDPQVAATLIDLVKAEDGREELLRRFAQAWAEKDPAAALSWAEQLANFTERRSALTDIIAQMAQSNPADAISTAERYQLGRTDPALLQNLAGNWAEKDLPAAIDWANLQPAGEQRDQVLARIAMIESQAAPVDAANRVLRDIPPGAVQNEAVMAILNQWATRDFDSAAAWVAQFPDGPLRERAVDELNGIQAYQMAADFSGLSMPESVPAE